VAVIKRRGKLERNKSSTGTHDRGSGSIDWSQGGKGMFGSQECLREGGDDKKKRYVAAIGYGKGLLPRHRGGASLISGESGRETKGSIRGECLW